MSADYWSINWAQSIVTGLIAAIGIFFANYFLDRYRLRRDSPILQLERQLYPTKEPIDLTIYDLNDPTLRKELWEYRNFSLKYAVYRLKVRNTGRSAATNCKAVLNDGEDKKICWNVPSERQKMTINAYSSEYLDVCAVLQSEYTSEELINQLNSNIDKVGHGYADIHHISRINEHYPKVKQWSDKFELGYFIPKFVAPTENGWQNPPHLNWHLAPGDCSVTVSAENAESQTITIRINETEGEKNRFFEILPENKNKKIRLSLGFNRKRK